MHAIADTEQLLTDGVITRDQKREIEARAREAMVSLAINSVLCFGILAATAGLIFWLANALLVALFGMLAVGAGLSILARGGEGYRIFGNASALIGAGMLVGGASFELIDKYEEHAHWGLLILGGVAAGAAALLWRRSFVTRFVTGAILLMGVTAHLGGLAMLLLVHDVSGLPVTFGYLYASALILAAGLLTDTRSVSALAIMPFAQALDTGTAYFHAAYVFYSPEPTLSILQMSVLVVISLWVARHWPERIARHARVLAVLGFVVANLCALVGSLFGDYVGETIWGPPRWRQSGMEWEEYQALREAFQSSAFYVSEGVYSAVWAVLLVCALAYGAFRSNRGMFNTALTFAAIHAYTQLFESFGDEPLAYVVGGLAAIPLAWGMWRLNAWITAREIAA